MVALQLTRGTPTLIDTESPDIQQLPISSHFAIWGLRAILVLAIALGAYLTYSSVTTSSVAGCGAGSECATVLASKYAKLFGIPVAGLATLTYLILFGSSFLLNAPVMQQNWFKWANNGMAGCVFGAAVAYVSLQLVVLKAICPYCMVEHGLGLIAVGLILLIAWNRYPNALNLVLPFLIGIILTGGMVLAQSLQPDPPGTVIIGDGEGTQEGTGINRIITLNFKIDTDQGAVVKDHSFKLTDHLLLGNPEAQHVLIKFFDHACPHCRKAHHQLEEIMKQYPEKLVVVMVPTPINGECNAFYRDFENERFKYSCDLAHYAYAVFAAAPELFPEYDAWLFENDTRPTADEARQKAIALIGEEALNKHFKSEAHRNRMASNISAFMDVYNYNNKNVSLPILLAPDFPTRMGSVGSTEEMLEILHQDLFKDHPHTQNSETKTATTP